MGVSKSALQSVSRYLARYLGPENIRSNLVAAGPLATIAAKSIPGFVQFDGLWEIRAPLGWDTSNPEPVARMACVLMSDFALATSGEIVHVDGGFHAVAAGVTEGL
jgi:enoyl-[acyl-carrier protein] reductase I